jgi:hypothetical protein
MSVPAGVQKEDKTNQEISMLLRADEKLTTKLKIVRYKNKCCRAALTRLGIPISGLAIHPTTAKRI